MSFWDRLGEFAESATSKVNPIMGVYDTARSVMDDDSSHGILRKAWDSQFHDSQVVTAGATDTIDKIPVASQVQSGLLWMGNEVDHTVATAWGLGDMTAQSNAPYFSKDSWKRAWAATADASGFGMTGGYLADKIAHPFEPIKPNLNADGTPTPAFAEYNRSSAGKFTNGAMEVLGTWYIDPTIAVGAAAKVSRAANTIEDSAKADQVSKAFTEGDKAATPGKVNPLANTPEETATRLARQVARTDNMTTDQLAAHMKPVLARSGNAAPVVDLMGQAGRISDLAIQRQVKADILLTAAGSAASRERLIQMAPEIARGVERASNAPVEFAMLDDLSRSAALGGEYNRGSDITAAARLIGQDTGNVAEITAYGQQLDQIHRQFRDLDGIAEIGGIERVGTTALDRWKQASRGRTSQFYYQDSASGRTVRALHWATSQRSRDGAVATNDAFRGHEELMDHLARMKVHTGAERAAISQRWWKASEQAYRNDLLTSMHDDMIARVAAKDGGYTEDEIARATTIAGAAHKNGRKYSTAQMEQARASKTGRVTLEDPNTGVATTVDTALFETHIANTVALPDTDMIKRLLEEQRGTRGLGAKTKDVLHDVTDPSGAVWDWWRLGVLARPGLFVRTQLDTQGRSLAMLGATSVVGNMLTGMGHKLQTRFSRDELVMLGARAEDEMLRTEQLDHAADLRHQASVMDGVSVDSLKRPSGSTSPAAQRLLDRADEIEAAANKPVEHIETGRHLGSKDYTVTVDGVSTRPTRAYTAADDRLAVWDALLPGEASMSDLITNLSGRKHAKIVEDSNNWKTYLGDDPEWENGWIRGTDALRTSYTGRKILQLADHPTVDLVATLRKDPKVRKNWLNVKNGQNEQYDAWLERAVDEVTWMAPTPQIRAALLSGKRIKPEDMDQWFVARGEQTQKTWDAKRASLGKVQVEAKRALQDHMAKGLHSKSSAAEQERLQNKLADATAKLKAHEEASPLVDTGGKVDRMPTHGPDFSVAKKADKSLPNFLRWVIKTISDEPDTMLARHPVYVTRYDSHFTGLAKRAIQRGDIDGTGKLSVEAQVKIEKMARNRAIQDVRQTMYDTARYTGAHAGVMRIASPFLNAWEDAMMSWSRLMYDDPKVLGALVKTWNAPERFGIVHDQDGNLIKPGQHADQKFVALPLGAAGKFIGIKELQLRKDSWNSIFQGETWWQPGYGPVVTVPAQQIATRAWPEIGDENGPVPHWMQPFIRNVLNGESPKVRPGVKGVALDAGQSFLPSWLNKALSAFDPTAPAYTNVFQDSMNSQVIAMRDAGKEPTQADWNRITLQAQHAARSTAIVKAIALGGFGQSAEGNGIAKYYGDQYNTIQAQADSLPEGKTPEQVFNERFPEAAGLNWSVSFSDTGINAYITTEDRAKTFEKEIENPATREYGWAYEGEDNVGGEFSPSIYNAQSSRRSGPGTSDTQRRRQNPEDMVKRNQVSLGWAEYQRVQTKIDLILEKRGLNNVGQGGAEDLAQIKRDFVAKLSADNPIWGKDYDSFDNGVVDRFITNFAKPMLTDKRAKGRQDIELMGQYLAYRQRAMEIAKKRGVSLASKEQASDLRAILAKAGAEYAKQDLGFMQQWQRVLSREVVD